MRTRLQPLRLYPPLRRSAAATRMLSLLSAGLLAACGQAPPPAAPDASAAVSDAVLAAAAQEPAEDCLLLVWERQSASGAAPDVDFDRENDRAEGGAISCATGTSPSQFEAALDTIRGAARRGDKAAILSEVGIPVLHIDAEGNRRELTAQEDVDAAFEEVFDAGILDMMKNVDLADMAVVEGKGGYFELGSLWLVVPEPGERPKIVTVNRQALGEAASAASQQADAGAGRELPAR
ncbi:hypothetical protein [Pseudopontixanthobacter vadosimaris]|uniref:hypothetical protein n=1 Tax=Pseudopontixanthobacter vadosimaris TaxID=2726450 RepID=UPI001F0FE27C|nr:hypothetical protein [Pseudopontixanthobacter vadosimaris]